MLSDLELFRVFNVELPSGKMLWNINKRPVESSMKIVPSKGEPGSQERIEYYRQRAEKELPLW